MNEYTRKRLNSLKQAGSGEHLYYEGERLWDIRDEMSPEDWLALLDHWAEVHEHEMDLLREQIDNLDDDKHFRRIL